MIDFLKDTTYLNFALFIQEDLQQNHNNCNLRNQLIHYRQLVSYLTRENKTLDHFYIRTKRAFCALSNATSMSLTLKTIWTPTLTQYVPTSPSVRQSIYLRRPLWAMVTPVLDFQRNCGIKKKKSNNRLTEGEKYCQARNQLKVAKGNCRWSLERQFNNNDSQAIWCSLHTITN